MTPFGSKSVILNTTNTALYTCPAGRRVKISNVVFTNTNAAAISVGLWYGATVAMNGHVVPGLNSYVAPHEPYLNEGETLYGTATVSGWVTCSLNFETIEITNTEVYDPPGLFMTLAGKTPMASARIAGERTLTGLIFSQSMSTNNVEGTGGVPFVAAANVANLHTNGMFYRASGAILGCGGNSPDNAYSRFGHLMGTGVALGGRANVVVRGVGSTNPQDFTSNGQFGSYVAMAAENLQAACLQADFVDLEWGSRAAVEGMSATDFRDGIRAVVAWIRECGIYAPVFVAKHTRFAAASMAGEAAVRTGVDLSLSAALSIYDGPDMDVIPDSERSGGAHLLPTGAAHSAQLRYDHHAAFFTW